MPDLTIEIMQICAARSRTVRGNIRGYEQALHPDGYQSCTCPAWKYSKGETCKHVRQLDAETCSYFEQIDGPPKTDGVCPHCGGPTEYVRVAV